MKFFFMFTKVGTFKEEKYFNGVIGFLKCTPLKPMYLSHLKTLITEVFELMQKPGQKKTN